MGEIFSLFLELLVEFIICFPPDREKHSTLHWAGEVVRLTLAGIMAIAFLVIAVFFVAKLFQ